ncbi:MAG: hypothetical protein ACP5G7_02210 [Anaerolineae bacterium]
MQVNADYRSVQRRSPGRAVPDDLAVHPELECPNCGETRQDKLIWLDMERVRCTYCGATFHVWANRAD